LSSPRRKTLSVKPPVRRRATERHSEASLSRPQQRLRAAQADCETVPGAQKVWNEVLTEEQRQSLGGKWKQAWRDHHGTLGILSRIWNCNRGEALLRLVESYSIFAPVELSALRTELKLPASAPVRADPAAHPIWNKRTGKLSFLGEVTLQIRSVTRARRKVAILDAFEAAGWPPMGAVPL
jgi:hypothetical protein